MNTNSIRVLRWVYSQHDDSLICELRLADDGLSYQLTTTARPQSAATDSLERFRDVAAAFQRQCDLERKLIEDGWSLESYESHVRDAETVAGPAGRAGG